MPRALRTGRPLGKLTAASALESPAPDAGMVSAKEGPSSPRLTQMINRSCLRPKGNRRKTCLLWWSLGDSNP